MFAIFVLSVWLFYIASYSNVTNYIPLLLSNDNNNAKKESNKYIDVNNYHIDKYIINTSILLPIDIKFDVNCSWHFIESRFNQFTQQSLYQLFYRLSKENRSVIFLGDSITRRTLYSLNHAFDHNKSDSGPTWHVGFKYKYNITKLQSSYYLLLNETENINNMQEIITKSEWTPMIENVTDYLQNKYVFDENKNVIFVIGIGSHQMLNTDKEMNFSGYGNYDTNYQKMWTLIANKWIHLFVKLMELIKHIFESHKNVKFIFRTQTTYPKYEKLVLLWNKIMLHILNIYISMYSIPICIYNPWSWSHAFNKTQYYSVIENKIFQNMPWQSARFIYWNKIRNKCTICEDLWECIHFNSKQRNILLQQTLMAITLC